MLGLLAVAGPLDSLPAESLDLVARGGAEVLVERLTGVELRNFGISSPGMLSATGTRELPDSMASINEKSLAAQGNSVPSR